MKKVLFSSACMDPEADVLVLKKLKDVLSRDHATNE